MKNKMRRKIMDEFREKYWDKWNIEMNRDNLFIYKKIKHLTKGIIYEDIMWLIFCITVLVVESLLFFEFFILFVMVSLCVFAIMVMIIFDIMKEVTNYKNISKETKKLEDELLDENN
jgi:hypothetical protein